ncbi:hypothetical protein HPB52_023706 [Rhipicephalus sanguineus]|uniref:Uncharacterized protein n=1 Tax=Rhipicephalus sanguineus TaxID=34632 RepID=A0A9D4YR19_RHISA|nr:hypothetical protein HPB52_023706 [Rhipicephalus sanguineus]
MATITSTHTAFGFDCALDWRPTSFVEAVSSSYVCSACKLVPRILTVLPCRHKLCPQCCIHAGRRINHCPLDKKAFDEKDVMFSILGTESVLSRRVRCWNAEHGCDVEDEASVMLEHFRRDCRFHFASCPNCGRTLPHRDVSSHLESCRYPEEPYSPEEYTREEHSAGKSLAEYLFSAFEEVTRRSLDGNTSVIRWHPSIGQRLSSERTNETTRPTTTVVNTVEDAVASTRAPYDLVVFASPDEIDSASAERELSSSALSTGEPSQSAGVLLHKSASAASDEQDNLCAAPANPFMSRTKQATVAVSGSTAIDDALAGAENIEDETESQSKLGPGASLEALMDVPECCEFTIENWSSFTEDKPLATAVYGQSSALDCGAAEEVAVLIFVARSGSVNCTKLLPALQETRICLLLIELRFCGAGTFQVVADDLENVSLPTVSRVFEHVSRLIAAHLFPLVVKFPNSDDGFREPMVGFYRIPKFPGVTGCIDCTHIRIKAPGGPDIEVYRNQKSYFSRNVQTKRVPGLLLGDAGYPCLSFPMTLTADAPPDSPERRLVGLSHIRTRNTIEIAFGVWKRRFLCLYMGLQHLVERSAVITTAFVALHNLAILGQDPEPPAVVIPQHLRRPKPDVANQTDTFLGSRCRRRLIARPYN